MTVTVEDIPFAMLLYITECIIDKVSSVNRVLYDLTLKPTGTIEYR